MSFLRRLFRQKSKRVIITVCGLDKAGKTTIIEYLVAGEHKATIPTMGVNREVIDLPNLQMDIFDLGGQEDFRGLWSEINEKSDGLVYVVDSIDYLRFNETKEVFHNIINGQINTMIPILLLLNKSDLPNPISRPEFIERFELMHFANIKWACYVTSAISGEGVYEAFKWFIDQFKE